MTFEQAKQLNRKPEFKFGQLWWHEGPVYLVIIGDHGISEDGVVMYDLDKSKMYLAYDVPRSL